MKAFKSKKHSVSKGIMPIVCFSLPIDIYSVDLKAQKNLIAHSNVCCYVFAKLVGGPFVVLKLD